MRKLSDKDLEMVSGGDLSRGGDGSYILCGRDDKNRKRWLEFGHDFYGAVEYDWKWFKRQYIEKKINSLQDLEKYYNYGNF
ncbi:MAG: hypothetical protein RUMPE_00048 [Eubacteriales bacterium SKADARSKE-1]|nr:hypothetical protein [Eubacteriales bacterium SKADARSKE-1]